MSNIEIVWCRFCLSVSVAGSNLLADLSFAAQSTNQWLMAPTKHNTAGQTTPEHSSPWQETGACSTIAPFQSHRSMGCRSEGETFIPRFQKHRAVHLFTIGPAFLRLLNEAGCSQEGHRQAPGAVFLSFITNEITAYGENMFKFGLLVRVFFHFCFCFRKISPSRYYSIYYTCSTQGSFPFLLVS